MRSPLWDESYLTLFLVGLCIEAEEILDGVATWGQRLSTEVPELEPTTLQSPA